MEIRDVSKETKAKIVEVYNKKMNQLDAIFEETTRLLSMVTEYAAIVLEPAIRQEAVKKVKLVHISDTVVLAVVIMDTHLTKNLNIYLENPVSEEEVENINRYLNESIQNSSKAFTLSDLKEFFVNTDLFESEDFQDDHVIDEGKLFFEGGTKLLENNISDVVKVIDRMKFFNNPEGMKRIFSQFIRTDEYKDGEVNVIFGDDLDIAGLEDFSFVFSVYTLGDAKGVMGVIGPKRMEYSKTVGLVEYVSEEVQQILKRNK